MRTGTWLSGFMAMGSLLCVSAAILLCSLAALAVGELPRPVAERSVVSSPVLVAASTHTPAVECGRGVVYELEGRYYHLEANRPHWRSGAGSTVLQATRTAHSSMATVRPKVYVAEDSEGFLAVVVSSAGDVRVFRQADESFVTD